MPSTKIVRKPALKFYTFSELFVEAWQVYSKLVGRYFYFLVPVIGLQVVSIFLAWRSHSQKPVMFSAAVFLFIVANLLLAFLTAALYRMVYIIIFRDRDKKLTVSLVFSEIRQKLKGYGSMFFLAILLEIGGYLFFLIPGLLFSIWFGFYSLFYLYDKKSTRSVFAQSRELVRGYASRFFFYIFFPPACYIFLGVLITLQFDKMFGVTSYISLFKTICMMFISILVGSFMMVMKGLMFERLLALKGQPKPKSIDGQKLISVLGWVIGWLPTMIIIGAIYTHFYPSHKPVTRQLPLKATQMPLATSAPTISPTIVPTYTR